MGTTMKLAAQILLAGSYVVNACVVNVGDFYYDFTSLSGTQIVLATNIYNYEFTFCQASPNLCFNQNSSLCQTLPSTREEWNLALWSTAAHWKPGKSTLSGEMYGDDAWCPGPRDTLVTFNCVDGPAKLVSVNEKNVCYYEAVIEVPLAVCGGTTPCCAPATYSATRIENDGTVSVVQADAVSGNWYDSNFNDKGSGLLCNRAYNRCFTFTDTTCASSPYQPVSSQCYGATQGWEIVKKGLLTEGASIEQTAWFSKASNSYVVTMPFGEDGSCVVVSGNKLGSSFEFNVTTNATLWSVPLSCLKFA